MGKRGRRRARENGEPQKKVKQRLGQVGPFMVCRECKEPLTLFSLVDREDEFDEVKVLYHHPGEYVDFDGGVKPLADNEPYDHEAVPVEGDPLSADSICDFCHSPEPQMVFVPRKVIRMPDPLGGVELLDYSSPWNCCKRCLQAVKSKSLTKMLNQAMASEYSVISKQPPEIQQITRVMLRDLYAKYIDSNPSGPYEIKIPPKSKAQGTPGGRKGM